MSRSTVTIQTELDSIRTAIDSIVHGEVSQASIGDRSVTKLDLEQLRKREKDLIHELNQARGIRRFSRAKFVE